MTAPFPRTISGAGGGKKSKGSGGGVEAPNSLKSKQVARVIDLLGEGPVWLANGVQSIFFDGVPLQNPDGRFNFTSLAIDVVVGEPNQPLLSGFSAQQAEIPVGLQLKTTSPITRSISNAEVDRCRITVSVPALQHANKNTGDIKGTAVQADIYLQSNGGGYQRIGEIVIEGKTSTRYQRAVVFDLTGAAPWEIRLVRVTPDSTVLELQNDIYWDSYTEIIDARVNYSLSACVGLVVDAEQFQAIPKRTYDVLGLHVSLPSNYDPRTRTYSGIWDGTYKLDWTNNPAWVFFDLVGNSRYGLGAFVNYTDIDQWAIYSIGQWCDQYVPNGHGGYEPRFACNVVINTQQEAFDLVNSLASIFRGVAYWAGGKMVPIADMPADPGDQYTNANVIDGSFTYSGSDIRARHNMAAVSWNDPDNLGEPRITIVEDHEAISLRGIQKTDVIAIGCTSESQAIRTGRWALFSENYENETVTFRAGLDTAWCRPGHHIQISDVNIGGERRGGRVVSAAQSPVSGGVTFVDLDYGVAVDAWGATPPYYLSCVIGEGKIETRPIIQPLTAGALNQLVAAPAFSAAPVADSIWVLASSDLAPTLWRVVNVSEADKGQYEVTAIRHRPDKWNYIEQNLPLSQPDISNLGDVPAIANLNAKDYLVALSAISVGVRMLISWTSVAPAFDVAWRPINSNWNRARVDQTAHDVPVEDGAYEIWVTPVNALGRRGVTARIIYHVVGLSAPPEDPKNFRIQSVQGVAMFQWAPATDLDVVIGGSFEMRYSPRTDGASWSSSNTVLTSIPGTATTVELPYRPGTYLLRTRDIQGNFSRGVAIIVTTGPDTDYRPFYRICEQPTWQGNKVNTEVRMPQQWLVLGVTGGLWDEQTGNVDDWPTIDVLPLGPSGQAPGHGSYAFFNVLDMGGVFPVRLTVDMLAFPFINADVFIDERAGLVDDWQDWDNAADDGQGMVTIRVRWTDGDPSLSSAIWSPWTQFLSGEYTHRGFQFQALLDAPAGQNVAIEELCILADISAKQEQGADVAWVPVKMHIAYTVKFYTIPAISIALQQGVVGDTFRLTNKTREGFDIELIAGSGAIITAARTFDWIAAGY